MILNSAKSLAKRVIPKKLIYHYQMRSAAKQELILGHVLSRIDGGVAIDVGANVGVYSYAFSRRARRTLAFEPLPDLARLLAKHNPRVEVHNCALSDTNGQFMFYVPLLHGRAVPSRASFDPSANPGFQFSAIEVPARRLDDFDLTDVCVIKIDVEGHEREVFEGAKKTIMRSKPILVIEIEERHHPNESWDMIHWIEGFGYKGFYVSVTGLHAVEEFDFSTMQDIKNLKGPFEPSTGEYFNNFLFLG